MAKRTRTKSQKPKRRRARRGVTRVVTMQVHEVAPTGEGVGRLEDGRVLFVPGAIVGEELEVQIDDADPRRGRLLRIREASEDRVSPPCVHAERCGGCNFMHMRSEAQLRFHRETVLKALSAVSGGTSLPELKTHQPCPPLAYRSRARLGIEARAPHVRVGYRVSRSHRLAEVDACSVLRPEFSRSFAHLVELLNGSEGTGEVSLALNVAGGVVLDLHWRGTLASEVFARAESARASGHWDGLQIWSEGATRPATFGDPRPSVPGADGLPLQLVPGAFSQASDEAGVALGRRVGELTAARRGRTVELFAGCGTLSVVLAAAAEQYVAVEQSEEALEALRSNLRARALESKTYADDANRFVIPKPTATVVLDPPRAGAAGAIRNIVAARPAQLVYVSCKPATLARDMRELLAGGYVLTDLEIFELFPQTAHVEVVVRLERG